MQQLSSVGERRTKGETREDGARCLPAEDASAPWVAATFSVTASRAPLDFKVHMLRELQMSSC